MFRSTTASSFSPSPDLSSFPNLQTFQHTNRPTLARSIPFRITFFAHPPYLTLIESHSCKKQGEGGTPTLVRDLIPPKHFPIYPQRVNIRRTPTPATPLLSCVCLRVRWIPGVGLSEHPFTLRQSQLGGPRATHAFPCAGNRSATSKCYPHRSVLSEWAL